MAMCTPRGSITARNAVLQFLPLHETSKSTGIKPLLEELEASLLEDELDTESLDFGSDELDELTTLLELEVTSLLELEIISLLELEPITLLELELATLLELGDK